MLIVIDYDKVLSNKIQKIKPSGIRKFFDIAGTMKDVISLGVGEPDFDPEFDENSEVVSRNLAAEYRKVALQNHAAFLNAADYALPSITDREHLDEKGHAAMADAIYDKIIALQKGLSNVI